MSPHPLTPIELVRASRALIATPDATTAGAWPRASALLARQALEVTLDYLWAARAQGMEETPLRIQLIALGPVLRDPELAGRVSYAWWTLSRACHAHAYELPLTSSELESSLSVTEDLLALVMRRASVRGEAAAT